MTGKFSFDPNSKQRNNVNSYLLKQILIHLKIGVVVQFFIIL
jgi:hypothetical protein